MFWQQLSQMLVFGMFPLPTKMLMMEASHLQM
jgi:hypothetical protein